MQQQLRGNKSLSKAIFYFAVQDWKMLCERKTDSIKSLGISRSELIEFFNSRWGEALLKEAIPNITLADVRKHLDVPEIDEIDIPEDRNTYYPKRGTNKKFNVQGYKLEMRHDNV